MNEDMYLSYVLPLELRTASSRMPDSTPLKTTAITDYR